MGSADDGVQVVWVALLAVIVAPEDGVGQVDANLQTDTVLAEVRNRHVMGHRGYGRPADEANLLTSIYLGL